MAEQNMPTTYETRTTTTSSSQIGFHPEYLKTIPGILKVVEIVLALITFICASVVGWGGGGSWVQFVSMTAFLSTLIMLIFYLVGLYSRLPGPTVLIILVIMTLVSACQLWWPWAHGQAWIQFTSATSLLFSSAYFYFHLYNLFRVGQSQPVVLSLLTFISACVWWWGSAQGWVQFVSISAFLSTLVYLILHLLNLISRFPGPWLLIEFIYYVVFSVFFLIAAIVAAAKGGYHNSIGATAFFAFAATAVYSVDTFFQFRAWRTGQTEMTTQTTTTTMTTTQQSTNVEAQKAVY